MRGSMARMVRVMFVSIFALCLAQAALALRGRDFAGSYQISRVSETGSVVHLTITLNLWNHSSVDIRGGAVVLFDSEPNQAALGTFSTTKLEDFRGNSQVTLTQAFDVPRSEWLRWHEGRVPALSFVVPDADGILRVESIDLSRVAPAVAPQQ